MPDIQKALKYAFEFNSSEIKKKKFNSSEIKKNLPEK